MSESGQSGASAAGKENHLVPRQMIRRFAAAGGRLFFLDKLRLLVHQEPKNPRAVLFETGYYDYPGGSLDDDWLIPIEDAFGKAYPDMISSIEAGRRVQKAASLAFVDWAVAQLCRTRVLEEAVRRAALDSTDGPSLYSGEAIRPIVLGSVRIWFFEHSKELVTAPRWTWKVVRTSERSPFVLTDHPVCTLPQGDAGGFVLFVPISSTVLVLGGAREALATLQVRLTSGGDSGVSLINRFLVAWAGRQVYSARKSTLESLLRELRPTGDRTTDSRGERVREPHFGLFMGRSRMAEQVGDALDRSLDALKAYYGHPEYSMLDEPA